MLIDYMSRGFLDNIIALFRQDETVYRFIADMVGSENMRVRIGAAALVEELAVDHRAELRYSVPGLIGLLRHENPTVRGDAAWLLGIIQDRASEGALRRSVNDSDPGVREAVREALEKIRS